MFQKVAKFVTENKDKFILAGASLASAVAGAVIASVLYGEDIPVEEMDPYADVENRPTMDDNLN